MSDEELLSDYVYPARMETRDSPYVFREEPREDPEREPHDEEVVIDDRGRAVRYRDYRR